MLDIKHFVLSHAIWVVAVIIAVTGFKVFLAEHDARLAADAQIKQSEGVIQSLEQQITTNNQIISQQQSQIQQVSQIAAKKVQVVVKQQEAVKTPQQAITAILPDYPTIDARQDTADAQRASVLALPLFQTLSQCRITSINLDACGKNLASETQIAIDTGKNVDAEKAIVVQKDLEIAALKKKPTFWKRVTGTLKTAGICIGIGVLIGAHGI